MHQLNNEPSQVVLNNPVSKAVYATEQEKAPKQGLFGKIFLVITVITGLVAVIVESQSHLLASVYFDPIPHTGYISAYTIALLFPIFVAIVLKRKMNSPLMLAIAVAGNNLSLLMSAMMSLVMLPVLPVAVFACFIFGVGFLGFSPYFLFGITLSQKSRLRTKIKESNLPINHGRFFAASTVLATAYFLFIQPFASGFLLAQALQPGQSATQQQNIARLLHAIQGDRTTLTVSYGGKLPIWEAAGAFFANGGLNRDAKTAQHIYFLSTGKDYTTVPEP